METSQKPSALIEPIQYLRGLAAVLVLFHHVAFKLSAYSSSPLRWLHSADVGVDIFFVISGFVMAHSVRHSARSMAAVGDFLRGRIARIIPLYWLLTLVANLVYLVAPHLVNSSGGTTDILASYFLLPTAGKYLVQNGWTLAYEFYFYAIFSAGLLMPRLLGRGLVGAALIGLAAVGLMSSGGSPTRRFLFDPLVVEFAAGMALYTWYERGMRLSRSMRTVGGLIALALWVCVNAGYGSGVRILDYGVAATLLTLAAVGGARRNPAELPHRVGRRLLKWLGDTSYSLYLVHPFVVAACAVVLARVPRLLGGNSWFAGSTMLVTAIVAAGVLYRWGEVPLVVGARRVLRHGSSLRRPP